MSGDSFMWLKAPDQRLRDLIPCGKICRRDGAVRCIQQHLDTTTGLPEDTEQCRGFIPLCLSAAIQQIKCSLIPAVIYDKQHGGSSIGDNGRQDAFL